VKVNGSWMVKDLKTAVELQLGTPYDQQRLIFAGAQLADGRTLGEHAGDTRRRTTRESRGIPPDATVHMVLRVRGC